MTSSSPTGLDSDALRRVAGVRHWDGVVSAVPRLVELVEARLGRLGDAE